jgi:hypothetical protein
VAGKRKPKPVEVFDANIGDAERLIGLTRALLNARTYRMRKERREGVGMALRLPRRDWDNLDCAESDDVFVVIKPTGAVRREHFTEPELRPLLRQAVVAVAAAVESYVAEKACSYISDALDELPDRLRQVSVSLGEVIEIEERYERRRWGYRDIIEEYLATEASPSPSKIGVVFSTVGKRGFWPAVDNHRSVRRGTTEKQLEALAARRNRIAHTGDRVGYGRAALAVEEVESYLTNTKEIVAALEAVL